MADEGPPGRATEVPLHQHIVFLAVDRGALGIGGRNCQACGGGGGRLGEWLERGGEYDFPPSARGWGWPKGRTKQSHGARSAQSNCPPHPKNTELSGKLRDQLRGLVLGPLMEGVCGSWFLRIRSVPY